ncbi:MAG: hypothetical protein JWO36_6178 [Myxococcales bacterium]|nr:hypothetical protein [Myxococcales bacterium]
MRNSLIAALVFGLVSSFSITLVGCATSADEVTDNADAETSAPGSVDLWQDASSQWHFHVVSGNKRILLASEAYSSRTGAINGLLSTLDNGVDPAQYKVLPAAHGYLLHLVAANNEVIGFTESYASKASATRAITSCVRAVTSFLDKQQSHTTGARVEVGPGAGGKLHYNVFAANGQIVLSSETYTTEAAAWNGAFAAQDVVAGAGTFTIKTATDGSFYFTATSTNGQVVGMSQMYTTKAGAQAGIVSVSNVLGALDIL